MNTDGLDKKAHLQLAGTGRNSTIKNYVGANPTPGPDLKNYELFAHPWPGPAQRAT